VKDIVRESWSRRAANWPIGTCRWVRARSV